MPELLQESSFKGVTTAEGAHPTPTRGRCRLDVAAWVSQGRWERPRPMVMSLYAVRGVRPPRPIGPSPAPLGAVRSRSLCCRCTRERRRAPDAADGQRERRGAHVDLLLARDLAHGRVERGASSSQLVAHPSAFPAELLDVLRPLEVADGHAAGVGEDVGDDRDAPLRAGSRRPRASSDRSRPRR